MDRNRSKHKRPIMIATWDLGTQQNELGLSQICFANRLYEPLSDTRTSM